MKSLFCRLTVGFMLGYVTFFPSSIICGEEKTVPSPQTEYYSFCGEQTSADSKELNARGFFYYEAGDFASAIRCYQMSLAINPQIAVAHNNIGVAYLKMKGEEGVVPEGTIVTVYVLQDADVTVK